ncbi:MAG: HIT family protein [Candidatus Symbiothrix sp.]|jgi:histidine triad (HIT) family protein|nr:HIT family protein [Candidatus Symbiothrix sp.]
MTIFSKIIAGDIPCYKIAEDDRYFAFLDINPVAKGHVLVVPKQETDYLFDLDDTLLSGMTLFAKRIAKAQKKAIACRRIGVAVLGMEVPHAHIHLIPLNQETDLNFFKPKQSFSPDEMQAIAAAIRAELE